MVDPQSVTLPPLTEEIALSAIRTFFREKPFVFFGTGMSCALDKRFGMPALTTELCQNFAPNLRSPEQDRQWKTVVESLRNGKDLETALNSVTDLSLLQQVTHATGQFVSSIDRECALRIAKGDTTWPAIKFFQRLVNTLPEGDPILHVLTPNYDTLFEHACDTIGIHYTSGFSGGIERRTDWKAVELSLLSEQRTIQRRVSKPTYKRRKHVRLCKVHGSLNFFFHRNMIVENNSWMWNPPDFAKRVIITPGLSKYQKLQEYRNELLRHADEAIDNANQFLFLGYGFNDTHLETYMKQKLIAQACKGLIITRDCNPRIESLLEEANNLWIVCKVQEQDANGTRIWNKQYAEWLDLPAKELWAISKFAEEILGE